MATRIIRYQGAIVRNDHIFLIRYRPASGDSIWMFPGGGIEEGETEKECVEREMWEETSLRVAADRLLLDQPIEPTATMYQRRRTFPCTVLSGTAAPGHEPEEDIPAGYGIVEVVWFNLQDAGDWPSLVKQDNITSTLLRSVRQALGYI